MAFLLADGREKEKNNNWLNNILEDILTVLEHLNVADDDLADVAHGVRRACIERFENSAVVYA